MGEKLKVTAGVLLTMILLAAADVVVLEGFPGMTIADGSDAPEPVLELPGDEDVPTTPPPPGGVRKYEGPDIMAVLVSNGLTTSETRDTMILSRVVPQGKDTVHAFALLRDGDRAGAMAWVHSPDVKKHWLVLKEALHAGFTPEVQDLLDETQRREGHPTRNLLTFYDPGLLSERVVFVRVQERLYEFHVGEGESERIFNVIEGLTE